MSHSIPPAPPGWNKTFNDLFEELKRGERTQIGNPEAQWARDFERRQLDADTRFPYMGDIYEAMESMGVDYMTSWAAPYTGSGEGILEKGDRIVIHSEPVENHPIGVYAKAVAYQELESRLIPLEQRLDPKYRGFYFYFKTVDLVSKFRLLSEG